MVPSEENTSIPPEETPYIKFLKSVFNTEKRDRYRSAIAQQFQKRMLNIDGGDDVDHIFSSSKIGDSQRRSRSYRVALTDNIGVRYNRKYNTDTQLEFFLKKIFQLFRIIATYYQDKDLSKPTLTRPSYSKIKLRIIRSSKRTNLTKTLIITNNPLKNEELLHYRKKIIQLGKRGLKKLDSFVLCFKTKLYKSQLIRRRSLKYRIKTILSLFQQVKGLIFRYTKDYDLWESIECFCEVLQKYDFSQLLDTRYSDQMKK